MRMTKVEIQALRKKCEERRAEIKAVIASRKCPKCGATIRRNNAITGWWQCGQFGNLEFREDQNKPGCNWQMFDD